MITILSRFCCLLLFPALTRASVLPTAPFPTDNIQPLNNSTHSPADTLIQIVFTSDVHFGISRLAFEGDSSVPSNRVNARMVEKINRLPALRLPSDQGVDAGGQVGPIDYLMIAGDIANRQELAYQSATASWNQFKQDYLDGVTLKDHHGQPVSFLLVAGNHDVSNVVGYYKKMRPATDAASMTGIYNLMLRPAKPMTNSAFRYPADKINYTRTIGGICFMFVNIWPDSANRIWMEKELARIDPRTPVIIVTHDPPEADAAHFINPNGGHDINEKDRFENLLEEYSKDQQDTIDNTDGKPKNDQIEQQGFVAFLKAHPNIKAYFHGHNNWNQFYTYKGPSGDISLPAFRVDSPMKGRFSSKDETKLSFQLISIDPAARTLTVRECRWNSDPAHPGKDPIWGESITLQL